jgi:hypothetical protein
LAKRGKYAEAGQADGNEPPNGKAPDILGDFAEDLGRLLGTVQAKATTWIGQRESLEGQLTQIRDTAEEYLKQLRGAVGPAAAAVAKGAKTVAARAEAGRKKGFTMSAEARERIAAAQRKRWAKVRKAKKAGYEAGNGEGVASREQGPVQQMLAGLVLPCDSPVFIRIGRLDDQLIA